MFKTKTENGNLVDISEQNERIVSYPVEKMGREDHNNNNNNK